MFRDKVVKYVTWYYGHFFDSLAVAIVELYQDAGKLLARKRSLLYLINHVKGYRKAAMFSRLRLKP
jgi:hypothetical protein